MYVVMLAYNAIFFFYLTGAKSRLAHARQGAKKIAIDTATVAIIMIYRMHRVIHAFEQLGTATIALN